MSRTWEEVIKLVNALLKALSPRGPLLVTTPSKSQVEPSQSWARGNTDENIIPTDVVKPSRDVILIESVVFIRLDDEF